MRGEVVTFSVLLEEEEECRRQKACISDLIGFCDSSVEFPSRRDLRCFFDEDPWPSAIINECVCALDVINPKWHRKKCVCRGDGDCGVCTCVRMCMLACM